MNDSRPPAGRQVFISMGSNLGDRQRYLQKAVDAIGGIPTTRVVRISALYETEPVGKEHQPEFLNAAAELSVSMDLFELFETLKNVELAIGRTKTERWGPREIDIDVLYYDSEVVSTPELQIPHPEILRRKFVLVPLAEIAPDVVDPAVNKPVKQLLAECVDTKSVIKTSLKLNTPTVG